MTDRTTIEHEFDSFFEFPGENKSTVSSISCKLFAEHMAALIRADEREKCAQKVEDLPHWLGKTGRAEIGAAIRAGSE